MTGESITFLGADGRPITPPPGLIPRMEAAAEDFAPCLDGHESFVAFEATFQVKPEGAEPYGIRETRVWCEDCIKAGHFSTQLSRKVWRWKRYRTAQTDCLKKGWTDPGYPCVWSGDIIWGWIIPGAFIPNTRQVAIPPPRIVDVRPAEWRDEFIPERIA